MAVAGSVVTVAGAGVAGLTVALALARAGAEVTVLEQAPEVREFGAGFQISPNGMAVLRALGLADAVAACSPRTEAVRLFDGPSGARVLDLPFRRLRPQYDFRLVHRADLIAILAEAARAAGVQVRLLQRIAEVDLDGQEAVIHLATGERLATPLLIGADGVHSRTRLAVEGTSAPFFTGQAAWRAVIPGDPGPAVSEVYMGPGRHLVSYPLRDGTIRNIIAVEERPGWVEEGWTLHDDPANLRAAFAGFCPRVRGWLERVEEAHLWGLFRHPVAARWHRGAGVILGDAAHPTLPFLAQGANMALEDAWVLVQALARHGDRRLALAAYQEAREARVRRIVGAANANARNFHLSGPLRPLAHLALKAGGWVAPGAGVARFDWLYGHDVTAG